MSIDPLLLAAYREADYCVYANDAEIVLQVGDHDPRTDRLLADHGVDGAAFITGCNPGSRRLGRAENAEREQRLRAAVDQLGFSYLPGEGRDRDGEWGSEASLLVFGIGESAAVELAAAFGQQALVYLRVSEPPRLVLVAA